MKKLLFAFLGLCAIGLTAVPFLPAHAQVNTGLSPSQLITATASGADTSSANVALAPPAGGHLAYVCGFSVTGLGATAIGNVTATLGALVGNITQNYTYSMPAGATVPASPLVVNFTSCLPANSQGGSITLTVPGAAGNTSTNLNIWGYYQ